MMKTVSPYAVKCHTCRAEPGEACREGYCRNGYRDCTYAICYRVRDLPEPHVSRVALAAVTKEDD